MGEMGRSFDGSYAEYALLPNEQIYPIDSDLSWEVLAAIPETYYTAYGSLTNLRLSQDDEILVRGASSATGIAFCRLVKAGFPKVRVYGSTQNTSKREVLREQGYDDIFEDKGYILQTEKKFDKVLELIGPRSIKDSIRHINRFGIVCSAGQLGEQWFLDDFDPIMELKQDIYLTTFYSGIVDSLRLKEMFRYIQEHQVAVRPSMIVGLHEIAKAHEYLDGKNGFGKVVCLT